MTSVEAFRTALAIDPDPLAAAAKVAAELAAHGSGDALGFVYVTDRSKADMPAVVETLRIGTGVQQWVGTVGFGETAPVVFAVCSDRGPTAAVARPPFDELECIGLTPK